MEDIQALARTANQLKWEALFIASIIRVAHGPEEVVVSACELARSLAQVERVIRETAY